MSDLNRTLLENGFLEEDLDDTNTENEAEMNVDTEEDANSKLTDENVDEAQETQNFEENTHSEKKKSRGKKGLIYISNIPKHMNVTRLREILGQYGKIGRVYLQPQKLPGEESKRKKKRIIRHFTEGWVEFDKKVVAKKVAALLNNTQISTRKRSQFYDCLWSMKYLSGFKWVHLSERMHYEQQMYKQRLRVEVSQARKEATFFQANLDKSENLKKKTKKNKAIIQE